MELSASPSPQAALSHALALLPATSGEARSRHLAQLTSTLCKHPSDSLDLALTRTNVPSTAAFHARLSPALPEASRLLDALARRCARVCTPAGLQLKDSLQAAVMADRALQLQLACAGESATSLGRFVRAAAGDGSEVPLSRVVGLVEAVEAAVSEGEGASVRDLPVRKAAYNMSEVDALFFDAQDADSEALQRVWAVRAAEEGYHESMQTRLARKGGLASRVADAVARRPSAAETVLEGDGLDALRRLADVPPDEAKGDEERMAFFHSEVARAVANVVAGACDVRVAARKAVDSGLVGLLGEWATSPRANGHLQAEAWRALLNLQEAIVTVECGEDVGRIVYENGLLPMFGPGDVRKEVSKRCVKTTKGRREVDVIFVHGIRGGPLMTWRSRSAKDGISDKLVPPKKGDRVEVWPRDWLARDVTFARVLSVGHGAGLLRGDKVDGGRDATLAERAARLRRSLRAAAVGENGRAIVFVTHSYGGLLVKEAVARDEELWGATRGLVFFSTPHVGSPVANPSGVFSAAVREMDMADVKLGKLHDEFVRAMRARPDVGVVSFGETIGFGTARRAVGFLVPRESADPGVGRFDVVEKADHIGVCKVGRRSDWRYRRVIGLIMQAAEAEKRGGKRAVVREQYWRR